MIRKFFGGALKKVRLAVVIVLFAIMSTLAGCSGFNPVSLLTGGGPNVAANVQAGKTNAQTLGKSTVIDQKIVRPQARSIEQSTAETGVRAERVHSVQIEHKDAPWLPWALLGALLFGFTGWVLPTPQDMWSRSSGNAA